MNEDLVISVYPYVPLMLGLAVLASTFLRLDRKSSLTKLIILAACVLIPFLPVDDIDLGRYYLSVVGHVSATSTLLLAAILYQRIAGRNLLAQGELTILASIISVGSALLYASAFGLIGFNAFELGFGSLVLFSVLLAINVLLFGFGKYFTGCMISLTVIAYNVNLLDSLNYWDYFTDPPLAVLSGSWLIFSLYRSLFRAERSRVSA
ncbi:MAG: hypothetical protein IPM25_08900 [Chloracidobacterium sp.]|nr:hypothetical protein [Chloracidobacterium sp.]